VFVFFKFLRAKAASNVEKITGYSPSYCNEKIEISAIAFVPNGTNIELSIATE
jgi:hypothetical protein